LELFDREVLCYFAAQYFDRFFFCFPNGDFGFFAGRFGFFAFIFLPYAIAGFS